MLCLPQSHQTSLASDAAVSTYPSIVFGFQRFFDAVNTSDIPQTAHKHYNKSSFCAQQKMTHVRTRLVSAAALQRNSTGGVCHGVCNL